MDSKQVKDLAAACGFELAGIAAAEPIPEAQHFLRWAEAGFAGEMGYLTDHRALIRQDPRQLLPSAQSIVCVGKLYESPYPHSTSRSSEELGWISRYAWGGDYHEILRDGLKELASKLEAVAGPFEHRICVDTAPLLERAYARRAGLGWIGNNGCLINQQQGSWFFLGEMLTSLTLDVDAPPPDRCGTCVRCVDACPTQALIPTGGSPGFTLDSRLCIAYLTIEKRGEIPETLREGVGTHVFGCDICQDVCPWNRRARPTCDQRFYAREGHAEPPLERLASIDQAEFRRMFRDTPVSRAKYRDFLRNVAVAMGNSGQRRFAPHLERLADHEDAVLAGHARWALARLAAECADLASRSV